jgi:hypothetical protein
MSMSEEIKGVELDLLREWVENGKKAVLPAEMVEYLSHLELVRGLYLQNQTRPKIVRILSQKPYNLTKWEAEMRFNDAINFFYIQEDIKIEAWANVYAEKMERMARVMLETMDMQDLRAYETYRKYLESALEMRAKYAKKDELPEEIYKKPFKVYTLDITELGLPAPSREQLMHDIDSFSIEETDKIRIKQEAGVLPPKIFEDGDS